MCSLGDEGTERVLRFMRHPLESSQSLLDITNLITTDNSSLSCHIKAFPRFFAADLGSW